MEISVFEMLIEDGDIGMYATSFVKRPAFETTFFYFSEDNKIVVELSLIEEKQIVICPLAIPNKYILRTGKDGKPYFIYFSEDTIRKMAKNSFKNGAYNKLNLEHNDNKFLRNDEIEILETWIIDNPDNDKSKLEYGFEYPKGTLMTSYKVNDTKIWNDIKEGKYNGLSLEGEFSLDYKKTISRSYLSRDEFKNGVIEKYITDILNNHTNLKVLEFVAQKEMDDRYREFTNKVNMTIRELEDWKDNPCSREASLDRKPINRVLRLLKTPKSEWGINEYRDAGKVTSFIDRMKVNTAGDPVNNCGMSKRSISLLNWGFNPGIKLSQEFEFEIEEFIDRKPYERKDEYIQRCMASNVMKREFPNEKQRYAVCVSKVDMGKLSFERIGFDFDGTLTLKDYRDIAKQYIDEGSEVFIVTKRCKENNAAIYEVADIIGIPNENIYFTCNADKLPMLKELGIDKFYDNNPDTIQEINDDGTLKGMLVYSDETKQYFLASSDLPVVINAINNRTSLEIRYNSPYHPGKATGSRVVEPFAVGIHKRTGNVVIRAYQDKGASFSGNPFGWKLFLLNGFSVRGTNRKFNNRPGFRITGDNHMSSIIKIARFRNP